MRKGLKILVAADFSLRGFKKIKIKKTAQAKGKDYHKAKNSKTLRSLKTMATINLKGTIIFSKVPLTYKIKEFEISHTKVDGIYYR